MRGLAGLSATQREVVSCRYLLDLDEAGLEKSYAAHREAYQRIFTRLGIEHRVVAAISGAMGGSASEEFLAPTPVGEDTFVRCTSCDYAANAEAVQVRFDPGLIGYRDLLQVFFSIHDPTTRDRQGNDVGTQYRSAIITTSPDPRSRCFAVLIAASTLQIDDNPR